MTQTAGSGGVSQLFTLLRRNAIYIDMSFTPEQTENPGSYLHSFVFLLHISLVKF